MYGVLAPIVVLIELPPNVYQVEGLDDGFVSAEMMSAITVLHVVSYADSLP
jgi:hypothetical protein